MRTYKLITRGALNRGRLNIPTSSESSGLRYAGGYGIHTQVIVGLMQNLGIVFGVMGAANNDSDNSYY